MWQLKYSNVRKGYYPGGGNKLYNTDLNTAPVPSKRVNSQITSNKKCVIIVGTSIPSTTFYIISQALTSELRRDGWSSRNGNRGRGKNRDVVINIFTQSFVWARAQSDVSAHSLNASLNQE
ncbi:hypothetical protein DPMN_008210 [Dreissena polymorpha]|uniref:Uncharacterized protein n=1 Tax=Dreissena polymorpha TaxID=45954 RepID=A0A9D4RYX9_DREPO|nr:hypothetical protein DPMN_008210 [Dreissena polymorpha]